MRKGGEHQPMGRRVAHNHVLPAPVTRLPQRGAHRGQFPQLPGGALERLASRCLSPQGSILTQLSQSMLRFPRAGRQPVLVAWPAALPVAKTSLTPAAARQPVFRPVGLPPATGPYSSGTAAALSPSGLAPHRTSTADPLLAGELTSHHPSVVQQQAIFWLALAVFTL